MGLVRGSDLYSVLVLNLVLNIIVLICNGGKTSRFVRKLEKIVDMPLDSDVFSSKYKWLEEEFPKVSRRGTPY
ncbi:unnamed protein product [Arabis nemorensis]|uniref:Uncharacterized protein n=1 Tax=Arabis nemorensis TaxID=586526 RepID=A0A565BCE4_9BRAS|nr:unnamed protein product [Arabis nemorensis]